ncbi:MAG: nucleotidyltransferase domain-containing protein [Bacteroidales bacterium]|nr:nucleotidyltransferase domain-containing protein [Bacteroidales bacterium]
MDKREAISTAQQYVSDVERKYRLTRSLLFGSYAKGNYHGNSDIDVAVVIKDVENLFDTGVDLMRLRTEDNLIIEPHVFRDSDFNSDDPIVFEILRNGIELKVRGE